MTPQPARSLLCPLMIGRAQELARVREHLERADGGVLLISGEAGVGKSRLVREARHAAARSGLLVLEGACFEPDRSLPLAPVRDLLRALPDLMPLGDVAQLAGPAASEMARLLPGLEAPGDNQGDAPPALEPAAEKRRRFDALVRLVQGLAVSRPVVVIVEDLHWSDDLGLEFLLYLTRRVAGQRLPLLLTYRSDEIHPGLGSFLASLDRERLATEVALGRLAPAEVAAMLRAIFGLAGPAPADFLHAMYTLTDGNPFFIEEVLKAMSVTDAILSADGTWQRRPDDELRIPRSIQDAVRRRVDLLGADARRLLVLAAIAGRRFDFDLLQTLAERDEGELLDLIKELIAAQLVVEEADDRFAFRHALTRQAIYAGLLERERRALHLLVAEALARLHGDSPDARLDDLAYHAFEARAWEQALVSARRAAERAAALNAPRAAIAQFTRALAAAQHLSLPPDPTLLHQRGAAYETVGEFVAARTDHDAALAAARSTNDRRAEWQALLDLGLLWAGRDYDRAGSLLRDALTLARDIGDPALVAHSLNRLGNWLVNVERPLEARQHHEEALGVFEALRDVPGVAETLDLLGLAHFLGGDLTGGTTHYERAVALWRELGDRRGLASSLIMLTARGPTFHTFAVAAAAPLEEAWQSGEEGLAIARAIGWRAGESWALWDLGGLCLAAQGAYARALESTRAGLAIAEEIEHRQWMVGARCMLGNIHADLFALASARQHLDRALIQAREIGSPYWIRSATGWLASVAVVQGDFAGAAEILKRELDPTTPMTTIAARLLWCAQAELWLATGEVVQALDLVDRLVRSAPGALEHPIARLAHLRGEALLALGRRDEAEQSLRLASETALRQGVRPMLWRIHAALGRLHRAQGRQPEAAREFGVSRGIIQDLAAEVPDAQLRAGFLAGAMRHLPPAPSPRRAAKEAYGGLTERERAVAALLTHGLSNREIAAALFLSEWTVATHIRNILAKLDLDSRTQIAVWAREHGLEPPR